MTARPMTRRACYIDGCDGVVVGRSLCGKHYASWRRSGVPSPGPKRPGWTPERKRESDRQWYERNSEAVKEQVRQWRERNPERRREQSRVDQARQRERNPEAVRASYRRWYLKNAGTHTERRRRWEERNPDRARAIRRAAGRRHEARQRGAVGSHTEGEWRRLLAEHHGLCAYCLVHKATERDHVLPLARGGSDFIDNIRPACRSCNARKHARDPSEWLAAIA